MVAVQSAADSFSDSKSVITRVAQLVAALQPGCEKMERKWRENEKMKRKWKESEEMERVVRACLVPIFFDNKSYWHHTNWYLQPAGTNIAVFSTLLPLPFAQNKREEEYSLYVLRYKSICPNSKAAGLVQCAMCSPTTGCNVMAFTSSHFAAKILQLFCFSFCFNSTFEHLQANDIFWRSYQTEIYFLVL